MTNYRPVLAGLRIPEIAHFVAAPYATRIPTNLGADVVNVESLNVDPVRQLDEQIDGKSLGWLARGRGNRCTTPNLRNPKAREIVLRMVNSCDAVIEKCRPGQLAKLGIGPEEMRKVRPDLVVAHVSGYAQAGPNRDRATFGVIGEAIGVVAALWKGDGQLGDELGRTFDVALTESVLA